METAIMKPNTVRTLALLASLFGGGRLRAQDTLRVFTPAEALVIGQRLRDTLVAEYGLITDPGWNQDVRMVLQRIQRAANQPGLDLQPTIIGDSSMNASALPGGFVIVHLGFLLYSANLARRDAPTDTAAQRARFIGYLAAVLGHEAAHVTLAHTNVIVSHARARMRDAARAGGVGGVGGGARREGFSRETALSPAVVEEAKFSQRQELDADRVGALYMLLSELGEIQHAMDFWRANDVDERNEGSAYSLLLTTYVSSHPRPSTREAMLEAYRAKLKLHQARFDDALTLIGTNTELDAAIALLDTVLTDFPDLLAARHARGLAYHQKWLNTVPIQTQLLRASLVTYTAHFLPGIKGAPGDPALLQHARADYEGVLAVQVWPGTQSNLALLDAYGGDFPRALERGEQAVQAQPESWRILNNYGVVLYLAGRPDSALATFRRGVTELGGVETPALRYNIARTLASQRAPGANAALERYLSTDGTSEWRKEVLTLLGRADDRPGAGTEKAPATIAGITLGSTFDEVVAALGRYDSYSRSGEGVTYRYPQSGIGLFLIPRLGVTALSVFERQTGAINGVSVGDPWSSVTAKWGSPAETSESGVAYFNRGTWTAYAKADDTGAVVMVGMKINR
jgi:predicted Zn-dependent protease